MAPRVSRQPLRAGPPAALQVDAAGDAAVPNLLEEAALFEWAGVGLAQAEVYRLFLAMTKLKAQNQLKSVRFFGKVSVSPERS